MKNRILFTLASFLIFNISTIVAQPLSGSFTDCNNRTEDIQAVLGTGHSLIIAHKGVDCSICVSQAPSFETWANTNKNKVKVWCALTWKYNMNTFSNPCVQTANWISTHSWSEIFTFPDNNRVFINNATPRYYVYSAIDSTIKYSGSNRSTAYSIALQESVVGIANQSIKDEFDWRISEQSIEINNRTSAVANIRLLDLNGRILLDRQIQSGNSIIQLNELPDAIYLMQFISEKGSFSEKVFF